MILAQKDTQLLDWERNNRINEIATVAAAEKLRSRVEDARDRDDGSKMSAAKAAEEFGGTSVKEDCRSGRTGRALTRGGKRLREREQESTSRKKAS